MKKIYLSIITTLLLLGCSIEKTHIPISITEKQDTQINSQKKQIDTPILSTEEIKKKQREDTLKKIESEKPEYLYTNNEYNFSILIPSGFTIEEVSSGKFSIKLDIPQYSSYSIEFTKEEYEDVLNSNSIEFEKWLNSIYFGEKKYFTINGKKTIMFVEYTEYGYHPARAIIDNGKAVIFSSPYGIGDKAPLYSLKFW